MSIQRKEVSFEGRVRVNLLGFKGDGEALVGLGDLQGLEEGALDDAFGHSGGAQLSVVRLASLFLEMGGEVGAALDEAVHGEDGLEVFGCGLDDGGVYV